MRIKHYVITRFLTSGGMGLHEKIYDDDIILQGVEYVNNYFIPSLNNQTNKNFEIIFLINDKHDEINSNIKLLNNVITNIPCHIVKKNNLDVFISNNSKDYDYLITSRMDYDDLVYNNAVEDIQQYVKLKPKYLLTYGYTNGTLLRGKKLYIYNPNYTNGYFSVFFSCIINLHNLSAINVCQLGNHTNIKESIQNICLSKNILYDENMFIMPKEDNYYFVWVRHENTSSSLLHYNKENSYNKEIYIEDFKKIFGISIL